LKLGERSLARDGPERSPKQKESKRDVGVDSDNLFIDTSATEERLRPRAPFGLSLRVEDSRTVAATPNGSSVHVQVHGTRISSPGLNSRRAGRHPN